MAAHTVKLLLALLIAFSLAAAPAVAAFEPDEPTPEEPTPEEPSPEEPTPDEGDEPEEAEPEESDSDEAGSDEADSDEAEEEPEEEAEPEEADEPDRIVAITNGRIHTVSGGTIARGTVLIRNGVIDAVGTRVRVPEEAEVIDATGKEVYPGLVSLESTGIVGSSPIADDFDPYALRLPVALAAGITTMVSDNTAAKLTWGTLDDTVLAEDVFIDLTYASAQPSAKARLRQAFEDVVQYQRDLAAHERAKAREKLDEGEESELEAPADDAIKGRGKQYLDLIEGRAIARFRAGSADDLRTIAEFVETFGFDAVIVGGVEGWAVAPQLARAGVSMVVSPRDRLDKDPLLVRPNGSTIENARILADHGIPVTFTPSGGFFASGGGISFSGLAGRDLAHFFLTGAYAVRGGLPERDAIRALTLDAARMIGQDHRIGSIEVGKDGDVIVTDGDLLDYQTHVIHAVVNGRVAYDKFNETLYSHIRPDGDKNTISEQKPDPWPRKLGDDW